MTLTSCSFLRIKWKQQRSLDNIPHSQRADKTLDEMLSSLSPFPYAPRKCRNVNVFSHIIMKKRSSVDVERALLLNKLYDVPSYFKTNKIHPRTAPSNECLKGVWLNGSSTQAVDDTFASSVDNTFTFYFRLSLLLLLLPSTLSTAAAHRKINKEEVSVDVVENLKCIASAFDPSRGIMFLSFTFVIVTTFLFFVVFCCISSERRKKQDQNLVTKILLFQEDAVNIYQAQKGYTKQRCQFRVNKSMSSTLKLKKKQKNEKILNERKRKKDRIVSTSTQTFWICVAMLLLYVSSESLVEAVCAPRTSYIDENDHGDLGKARDACLDESSDGICPIFAAASNGTGCNGGGVNGVIGDWDVSQVTNMINVFHEKSSFNADISKWDTGRVTNMKQLFYAARVFNGIISKWDVSKVFKMQSTFHSASAFNGDLANWDVSSVTTMTYSASLSLSVLFVVVFVSTRTHLGYTSSSAFLFSPSL